MSKTTLPDYDEYRIRLIVNEMTKARRRSPRDTDAIRIARMAFDEINQTKEFDFGVKLFDILVKEFTNLRDDLESMLAHMKTNFASAEK